MEVSNYLKVLLSKAVVLSVKEKAKLISQMCVMKMNENEPLMKSRKAQILSKLGMIAT